MRSLVVVVLCLGLCAAVQAVAPKKSPGVLLEGAEDINAPENPTAQGGRHHKKHHWGHHDYYPSAKEQFMKCVREAVAIFDETNSATWVPAGEALARCIATYLSQCHNAPGLPEDFTRTVPYVMFINGLNALVADNAPTPGGTALLHARTVLGFYLLGGSPTVPNTNPPVANPFYTGATSCASKLTALLTTGCAATQNPLTIQNLARVVVELIQDILVQGPDAVLGACAPDVPAVLLSVLSSYCPASGLLFNPFDPTNPIVCKPTTNTFEDSAGAQLGGSIISLLLLSGSPRLQALGGQVAFAVNRFALAATQTTDFFSCLGVSPVPGSVPTYQGTLYFYLSQLVPPTTGTPRIPIYSGVLGGQQASTPLPLGPDGQRVLCATIAMMSGGYGAPLSPWNRALLWQGSINIANAVAKTVVLGTAGNTVDVTPAQRALLCAGGVAAYTLSSGPVGSTPAPTVWVTSPGAKPGQVDLSCMSTAGATCAALPWGFTAQPAAGLATGHDLSVPTSWFVQNCAPFLRRKP